MCVGKKDRDVYYSVQLDSSDSSDSDPSYSDEVLSYSDPLDLSESSSLQPIGLKAAGDGGASMRVVIEGRGVA